MGADGEEAEVASREVLIITNTNTNTNIYWRAATRQQSGQPNAAPEHYARHEMPPAPLEYLVTELALSNALHHNPRPNRAVSRWPNG